MYLYNVSPYPCGDAMHLCNDAVHPYAVAILSALS
jgi:hypothetical protein